MSDWTLEATHEWAAHDPFGAPKPADVPRRAREITGAAGGVSLRAARGGYVSFRVRVQGAGEYRLSGQIGGGLAVDLFRAWYHRMKPVEGEPAAYHPDALIPVRGEGAFQIPDPDNRIDGQTTQEFWVDVFVPREAKPGTVRGQVRLEAGGQTIELPVEVELTEVTLPEAPSVVMDHNSYGSRWLQAQYPDVFTKITDPAQRWEKTIELLHHYYRIVHEHRGLFHNLGYGHSGDFDPIYGPRTVGAGRQKSLEGWALFDRHYGPLLDGSVFSAPSPGAPPPRRAATPVWGVYTPINPDWPASYLHWGEEGYAVEFDRCMRQFDAHLRENDWTRTRIEFFFNHKKRYRWFEWDGDEPKYAKDNAYHLELGRLWRQAVGGSPVRWVYRMDASWQMTDQFDRLAGATDFWVLGGFSRWFPDEIRRVRERGDTVWWYGGTPPVSAASSDVLQSVYKTWVRGFAGFCAWLTVSPGSDPWFACEGAATGMIYPGERFGIPGPIPSTRLKLERNGIQDVDLLDQAARAAGKLDAVREALAESIPIQLWEKPPPAVRQLPPEDWDSINLQTGIEPDEIARESLDPLWWASVRDQALAGEA